MFQISFLYALLGLTWYDIILTSLQCLWLIIDSAKLVILPYKFLYLCGGNFLIISLLIKKDGVKELGLVRVLLSQGVAD